MGPGKEDLQEVKVLRRIPRWTQKRLKYEADARHAGLIVIALGKRYRADNLHNNNIYIYIYINK